ncbi:hypothetical protein J6590_031838 [Homalodisca vitripennis]|nr:hypothetical protein J6590_031838 [Homalodisca vitripennis]
MDSGGGLSFPSPSLTGSGGTFTRGSPSSETEPVIERLETAGQDCPVTLCGLELEKTSALPGQSAVRASSFSGTHQCDRVLEPPLGPRSEYFIAYENSSSAYPRRFYRSVLLQM